MSELHANLYNSSNSNSEKDNGFASLLSSIFLVVGKYKIPFLLWIFTCITCGIVYIYYSVPVYTAGATVILEPRKQSSLTTDINSANYPPTLDSAQADSQIQVIKSERLLRSVFRKLNLELLPDFNYNIDNPLNRLFPWLVSVGSQTPKDPLDNDVKSEIAFQKFSSQVNARRIGQSYVIELSYSSRIPKSAASTANSIVMAYIGQQVAVKAAAAQNGAEYLQGRIQNFKQELEAANDGVQKGTIPDALFPDADARVIGAATTPLGKSFPQNSIIIAFSCVFSIFSGLIIIAIIHSIRKEL